MDLSLIVDEDFLEEVWAIALVARYFLHSKPSKRTPCEICSQGFGNPFQSGRGVERGSSLNHTGNASWMSSIIPFLNLTIVYSSWEIL